MKIKTEAKIGFITIATLALVIWGINFLKGRNVIKRSDVYYAVYTDVAGLKLSGSVILNGFKVGMINTIEFEEDRLDRIIVAFVVSSDFKLPRNSVAQIYSNDIMGSKVIRIIPSQETEFYQYGDTLKGAIEADLLTKIQDQISPLVKTSNDAILGIDTLVTTINQILDPVIQQKFKSAIINLESTTASLSRQLSPGGKIDKTLSSLQSFTQMLDANKDKLGSAFANIESITDSIASSNLNQTISNINSTFEQSRILLTKINNGEGSLGLLASNDSLYINLVSATGNLSILLDDMNQNPKRYVHFSLFGKKDKKN